MTRHRERYAHCFSKNRVIQFVNGGSHRGSRFAGKLDALKQRADASDSANKKDGSPANGVLPVRANPCHIQTESLALPQPARTRASFQANRHKLAQLSPTLERLYRSHLGLAVVCADCLHGSTHPNVGLPHHFKRQFHLTLLEMERRCRCEHCGGKNARCYPWWGEGGVTGPPR